MKRIGTILLVIGVFCIVLAGPAGGEEQGSAPAQSAYIEPSEIDVPLEWLSEAPDLSEEQAAAMEEYILLNTNLEGPPLEVVGVPEGPEPGTGTAVGQNPQAPGSFVLRRNADLSSVSGSHSTIMEGSVANSGRAVFYTANWFCARSTNGGPTGGWTYVSPYSDMSDFCCDQDVIYDPRRNILIWYRQGVKNGSSSTSSNRIRIGVSRNQGATWFFYDVRPTNLNSSWTGQWFDYPRIAISNDSFYWATNIFTTTTNSWTRTVMVRWPLDAMATGSGFGYSYVPDTVHGTFTPVAGATDTMYWGTHNSTSSFRVYRWPEGSGTFYWYNRTIPAWSSTGRGSAVCTTSDGYNPCARFDHRVLSGWIANWGSLAPGEKAIGFFWNVKQGSGFAKPYTNAALFRMRDLAYISRPFIWNPYGAFIYADGYPNAAGDLGISLNYSSNYPHHYVAIDDDYNGTPPGWEVKGANWSNRGPSSNAWGDYNRARPHSPAGFQWIGTGHILLNGTTSSYVHPKYVIWGRERDNRSLNRWILN